jgi:LuxR family maltose regulon positive regulatory protein
MTVIRARLAAFYGQTERVIDISEQMLRSLPAQYSFSRSELALSLSFAYMDREDLDAAAVALNEAIEMCRAAGNIRGIMYAVRTLGSLYMMRGQLHKAATLYNEHLEEAARSPEPAMVSAGFLHAALSPVLLEWNDLDGALEHAKQAVNLARQGGDGKILLLGYVPLVLAQQSRGEWAEALEGAERLNRLRPSRYNAAIQAEIWLAQGNVAAAAAWARSSGLDPTAEPRFPEEYENLTLARVLHAEGRSDLAIPLLEKMLARADETGRPGSALYVRIRLALCLLAVEDTARAVEIIVPALTLAGTEGYTRTFLDAGPDLAALLEIVLGARPSDGGLPAPAAACAFHLREILRPAQPANGQTAAGVQPSSPHTTSLALAEPLSEREIEVLRLIESGMSNQEIASRLVVTVGTVKTHLRNVYGKLDVHSRTQALAKAHSLELI